MTPEQRRDLAKAEFRRARETREQYTLDIPSVPICLDAAQRGLASAPVKVNMPPLMHTFRRLATDADEHVRGGQRTAIAHTDVGQLFWLFSLVAVGSRDQPVIRPLCRSQVMHIANCFEHAGFPTLSALLVASLDTENDSLVPTELLK